MKMIFLVPLLIVCTIPGQVFGVIIVRSPFDVDLEGWTISSGDASISYFAAGGNPGGYATIAPLFNVAVADAGAPTKFLGDQTAFDGGIIAFDGIVTGGPVIAAPRAGFGLIRITDAVSTVTQDIALGAPLTTWSTFSGPFNAAAFGTDQATWNSILSNITSLTVSMNGAEEASGGREYGLDNFTLIIPEPSTFALTALGLLSLAMMGRCRRRR